MADDGQTLFGTGLIPEGQGQPPSDGQAATPPVAPPETPPTFATKEELTAIAQRIEEMNKFVQKLSSRTGLINQDKEELNRRLEALQAKYDNLGIPVPETAKQRTIEQFVEEGDSPSSAEGQPTTPANADLAAINLAAEWIAKQNGVDPRALTAEDIATVKRNGTPEEFFETWTTAMVAVAERNRAGSPGGRAPMGLQGQPTGGNPIANITDSRELFLRGLKKLGG